MYFHIERFRVRKRERGERGTHTDCEGEEETPGLRVRVSRC